MNISDDDVYQTKYCVVSRVPVMNHCLQYLRGGGGGVFNQIFGKTRFGDMGLPKSPTHRRNFW